MQVPEILKFFRQFINPLMLLLVVAGGLLFLAYAVSAEKDRNNLVLASALLIVVLLTCLMTYYQERQAANIMSALKSLIPQQTVVIRDGRESRVPATELVVGDLVRLGIGDRVPADMKVIGECLCAYKEWFCVVWMN